MNMYDADIVARDSALPGLSLILNSERLLTALRTLPALRHASTLTVDYLRYKPGTSCVAGLAVTLGDGSCLPCFVKALSPERFQQSWRHPRRQALIAAGVAHAPQALPEAAMMLQFPAYDFTLRYLESLIKTDKHAAVLRDMLAVDPASVSWQFLRYKPERRAVIALFSDDVPHSVLRIASKNEYGRILQGSAVGVALGHIVLAGVNGQQRMLATRWLSGNSLAPSPDAELSPKDMSAAGIALGQLHQTPFLLPTVRDGAKDIQTLWWVFNTFAAIYPPGATRFQAQTRRIAARFAVLREEPVVIHGDFSADQVIKSVEGPLRFIDWDRCACGNALADLASFHARLAMQAIAGQITPVQAEGAVAAFVEGYRTIHSANESDMAWYSAWALLCLATEPFRLRAPDWPQQTENLLAHVDRLIEQGERAAHVHPSTDKNLESLVNPALIGQPLIQALLLPAKSQLMRCVLRRHKPERRALLEYHITLPGQTKPLSVLAKYRKKGLDRHGFDCQQALWRQGFNGDAPVLVPKPLALLPSWQIWLQEKADATPLTERLQPEHPQLAATGAQVGRALAALQQSSALARVAAARKWQISDELAVLARGLHSVAAQYPHWQSRLKQLLTACEALAQTLINETQRPIHRDFYPDQVMVSHPNPQQIFLVDFDLCCLSFAALDAGNYLAHIRELALRKHNKIDALQQHEQAFTAAFLGDSDGVSLPVIEKFAALSLARHIFLSTQFADRALTTAALIDECERTLTCWLRA